MIIHPEKKITALTVPLFAMKGKHDLGIGDTAALHELITWASENYFRAIHILPVNETAADNSPYNIVSAFALEPSTITTHPSWIPELSFSDYRNITQRYDLDSLRSGAIDYKTVKSLKRELLESAWCHFQRVDRRKSRAKLFSRFLDQHRAWLPSYTLYKALAEWQGNDNPQEWHCGLRDASCARQWIEECNIQERNVFEERRLFFAFIQWIAFSQWAIVADRAEGLGIALIGDVAVGVALGADVFTSPEEFDLTRYSGAPPEKVFQCDIFTRQWGQNWGFPLYRWEVMARNNFLWWRRRLRVLRSIFHFLRIDHVLGFFRIYSFPWNPKRNGEFINLSNEAVMAKTGGLLPEFSNCNDTTPQGREYNKRHGEILLGIMKEEIGEFRFFAEDLGEVPPYLRSTIQRMGIPGIKIPLWERSTAGILELGADYPRLSVATYATHDHAPMKLQWESWQLCVSHGGEDGEKSRKMLKDLLCFAGQPHVDPMSPFDGAIHLALLKGLLDCNSWIVIPMITDLLGTTQRFNVPGSIEDSNWTARINFPILEWNLRYKKLLTEWMTQVVKSERF